MSRPLVLVTRRLPSSVLAKLEEVCEVDLYVGAAAISREELLQRVAGKHAIVCLLTEPIDAAVLDAAGPQLKVVSNVAVGYNNIDLAACRSRGVVVTNTPDVLTNACADFTWGLILAITRRLGEGERQVRAGAWGGWALDHMLGMELRGKQLGLVGVGRIGRAVAAKAPAFGMTIAYTDQIASDIPGAVQMPLDRLLSTSDVVSLHVPMLPETKHLIDKKSLARMKRTAYLINTSRGPVVDEDALAWALKERLIAGAALDVYEKEPEIHPALMTVENVLLIPHLASATTETRTAMADLAVSNAIAVLNGQAPITPVPVNLRTQVVNRVLRTLAKKIDGLALPAVEKISESQKEDPFQILISTLLSARTQDATTLAASTRLFAKANTPQAMAKLSVKQIEKLIFPVGFYRNKAEFVRETSRGSVDKFGGRVPSTLEELITLPGVGRKTANLVLILAFRSKKQHLRGHPRAPHLESPRVGADAHAGGNRTGAVRDDPEALVAADQSVPRHLGTERLPAGVSSMS